MNAPPQPGRTWNPCRQRRETIQAINHRAPSLVAARARRRAAAETLFRQPKCEGTVEDHRLIALDVRELIRLRVFEQPVGRISNLDLTFPWLRVMRLNSSSLELQLATGRIVVVPLVRASCGAIGERLRLECLCVVGASARSTISTEESRVGAAMASGMRHSALAATAEKYWPSGKSAASLATTVSSGRLSSHQSHAACGGGPTRVIVRRWTVSNARN